MRRLFIKLITLTVTLAMLLATTVAVWASPTRVTKGEGFLSELAVIEAKDENEAKKILEDLQKPENGGFTGYYSLDLNAGGAKKIFLAYKTSSNVDDAITDLAVMNMNGDFSTGSYEVLLDKTLANYEAVTADYRKMAQDFKKNYSTGESSALTAYALMNYYYYERNGSRVLMGDYMLNFPEDNKEFSEILFSGNLKIIANLRTLLAMAAGIPNDPLASRIAEEYVNAEFDPSVYTNAKYEESAKSVLDQINEMKSDLNNLPGEIDAIKNDPEYDDEEKVHLINLKNSTLDASRALHGLLREIPFGNTNLGDYFMKTPVIELDLLYPIIAAATEAEALLMNYGSLYALLVYDVFDEESDTVKKAFDMVTGDYEPISIFYGVQNALKKGSIGVTETAQTLTAVSGHGFLDETSFSTSDALATVGYTLLMMAGLASTVFGTVYIATKEMAARELSKSISDAMSRCIEQYSSARVTLNYHLRTASTVYVSSQPVGFRQSMLSNFLDANKKVADCKTELAKLTTASSNATGHITKLQAAVGGLSIVAGIVSMAFSISNLVAINNKYVVHYTEIPDNMVNSVSLKQGDRFVNYQNVPAYYYSDGKLSTRQNDLNAYKGTQWLSLYYTKNNDAGYCLTISPDLIATPTPKKGYSPVHLFGYTGNFNLNAYCNREDEESIYLSFKHSTAKKSAEADVPDLLGSSFSAGKLAFALFSGFVLGIAVVFLTTDKNNSRSKKKEDKTI